MDELKKAMKIAFASEYAFAIKAQNFHWNVEGPLFPQLHMLFATVYEEVYGAIDDFAENIRKLGSYTPASFQRFSMLTQVEDELNMLQMKYIDGFNYKEIGEKFNITSSTVSNKINYIKTILKKNNIINLVYHKKMLIFVV